MEISPMSTNFWTDKPNVAYSHNGMLITNKEEYFLLSESSQTQRAKYCMTPLYAMSRTGKPTDTKWSSGCWGQVWVTADAHRVSLGSDEHVLEVDCGDGHTTLWIY